MPTLVRPWIVTYLDADGGRVPKGTRGARKSRARSAKWYGQGIPGLPPKKRVPLATDKAVARRMLDDLVRGAERGQVNLPDASAARRSLTEYLTEFGRDVALGLASRSRRARKKPSTEVVALTVRRVRDILNGCEFITPADLNDAAPAKLAEYLDTRAKLPKKDGGLSQQTAAFYLAAARRFAWWLSARARAPVRADLFDSLPGFDPKTDRRHDRRDITPLELAAILDAARSGGREYRSLTGEDRYHLWSHSPRDSGLGRWRCCVPRTSSWTRPRRSPCCRRSTRRTRSRCGNRSRPVLPSNCDRSFVASRPAARCGWGRGRRSR